MATHEQLGTRKALSLGTMQDIDRGRIAEALNHELRLATLDVIDRPGDESARKVTLVIELKPERDKTTGVLDVIQTQFHVSLSIPKKSSTTYPMIPLQDGRQIFQPQCPQDPRQGVFAFPAEARSEVVNEETGEVLPDGE